MKKVLITLLVFCVLAGSAFAQLTLGGDMSAGVMLEAYDGDSIWSANHRDQDITVPEFNLRATAQREDYGARLDITFRAQSDVEMNPLTLNGIYGWANFLDNTLRLTLGKISDAVWVANIDPDYERYIDKFTGFRFDYQTPLEGLSVGLAFPTYGYEGYDFKTFLENTMMGATYMAPMFNAVIAYGIGNNGDLIFGANYTGMEDLTAGVQLWGSNLSYVRLDDVNPNFEILQKVGYRVMRPMVVSFLAGQFFEGNEDIDPVLWFVPSVSYRLMPNLTGTFSFELRTADMFETTSILLTPAIEFSPRGPARLYVQYQMEVDTQNDLIHRFGFGIDVLAF